MGIIKDLADLMNGVSSDGFNAIQKDLIDASDASGGEKNSLISQINKSASGIPQSWVDNYNNKQFQTNIRLANPKTALERDMATLSKPQNQAKIAKTKSTLDKMALPDTPVSNAISSGIDGINGWLSSSAPVSDQIVDTEVDGNERARLEPAKGRFANEIEQQLENGEPVGNGLLSYYSDPLSSMAQDWHHVIASVANIPRSAAKAAYGEPEWGYNLSNGNYASYDDLNDLVNNEGFSNSYLLSGEDNQVYKTGDGYYVQLPNGEYGQVSDNDGNSLLSYDPDTDSFGFPNTDTRLDYADTQDTVMTPGIPVNMSDRIPEEYMPNSTITWQDFMDLQNNESLMPTQQNPGFLGLNEQRFSTPDEEADDLSKIRDSLPRGVADFPKWFLDVLASSAPFMLPGPLGVVNGVMTGLSDAKLSSLGLDPTTYDPVSQTYAKVKDEKNSDRMWREAGSFVDPVIDSFFGIGSKKLGGKMTERMLDKVAEGDKNALSKVIKKMEREEFKRQYPLPSVLGEVVGEGLEEVPGQWMQHVGDVGGFGNLGMNKKEDGSDDYDTPLGDRIKNEVFGYMAPDFLGGALFGGALKAPELASSTIKTGKSLKMRKQNNENRFKKFNEGHEDYDITDKMKQYIKSQEDSNGGENL